jgi:hypothetical protein
MKAPVGVEPQHAVIPTTVGKGQLIGFRRMSGHACGSILPVFKDASSKINLPLYQRRTALNTVLQFVGDPDLQVEQIIKASTDLRSIAVVIGDPAVNAYETKGGKIIAATDNEFRASLAKLLHQDAFNGAPFAGLEVSRYLKDNFSETNFAAKCARDLVLHSHNLAVSWVSGAALSPEARQAANAIINSHSLEDDHDASEPVRDPPNPFEFVKKVFRTGRQEERVALVIALMLENEEVATIVLKELPRDRGKFAQRAIGSLNDWSKRVRFTEADAAKFVEQLMGDVFPMNRPTLLLYLSKHLARYRMINNAIRKRVRSSRSMFLEEHRPQINRYLNNPKRPSNFDDMW